VSSLGKMCASLAAAGRLGSAVIIAVGASLTLGHGVAHAGARGFNIKHDSGEILTFAKYNQGQGDVAESSKRVGDRIQPGETIHFEVTHWVRPEGTTVALQLTGQTSGWEVNPWMNVSDTNIQKVDCFTNKPGTCFAGKYALGNNYIEILPGLAGQTVDAKTDPDAAKRLADTCATWECQFTSPDTNLKPVLGSYRRTKPTDANCKENLVVSNATSQPVTRTCGVTVTVGQSFTVGGSVYFQSDTGDSTNNFKVKITLKSSWSTASQETYTDTKTISVMPGRSAYILATANVYQGTGDIRIIGMPGATTATVVKNVQAETPGTGSMNRKDFSVWDVPIDTLLPPGDSWTRATLDAWKANADAKAKSG
jgi:hypothetical protein